MRLKMMLPTVALLTGLAGSPAFAGPVVVACAPGQRTIVRDSYVRGEPVTRVACVRGAAYRPVYRTEDVRYRVRRPHRSWGKTALMIGGSAGTGAGIGGLVHGKKGALIGAALGGGAASIYESTRRR
ncbi:MAG TPA: hypothetical protein VKD69_03580 [Vicinamibacterales bacterium]|nr:hypothetical protein [Vicinamibacterales bacterium]